MVTMMKNDQRILEEVERTLQALDNLPRLEPNPYLFTRIQARLASRSDNSKFGFLRTPKIKPIALAVVVLLNIATVLYALGADDELTSRDQLIYALSQDYSSGNNIF
jgi:hypothetical protein